MAYANEPSIAPASITVAHYLERLSNTASEFRVVLDRIDGGAPESGTLAQGPTGPSGLISSLYGIELSLQSSLERLRIVANTLDCSV